MEWLCEDENADHICDGCEARMIELYTDVEGDKSHVCICGYVPEDACYSEDDDWVCDVCGEKIPCEHELLDGENNGDGTHTGECIWCCEPVTQACDYASVDWDETSHWDACVCGALDPEVEEVEKELHTFTDGEDGYYFQESGTLYGTLHGHECDVCYYAIPEFHMDENGDNVCDLCSGEDAEAWFAEGKLQTASGTVEFMMVVGYAQDGRMKAVQVVDTITLKLSLDPVVEDCYSIRVFLLDSNYAPVIAPIE